MLRSIDVMRDWPYWAMAVVCVALPAAGAVVNLALFLAEGGAAVNAIVAAALVCITAVNSYGWYLEGDF